MMTARVDEQGRPEAPQTGSEAETLLGFLEHHRATLAWKCERLDATGLNTTIGPSSLTLGGLLKHLAYVEDNWFGIVLHGHDPEPPWDTVDWEADGDWDWHSAGSDSPEELHGLWHATVDRSRALTALALERGGLDQLAQRRFSDGSTVSLRWILTHMIEEYARHNGHADLLRENVDGQVGQ